MNRTHRVIWSESRQAFIVTDEKAKTKGKPSSTRKAIASAVVMALAALAAEPALAGTGSCPTAGLNTITTGTNLSCGLGAGDSVTVTNTGSISGTNPAVAVTGGNAASITNSGMISGSSSGIYLQNGSSVTGGISNSGTISGVYGIYLSGGTAVGSITNSGTISGSSSGIIINIGGSVGSITNSSTISGNWIGILLNNGTVTGAITNEAGGIISGSSIGICLSNSSSVGSISNSGTISGSSGNGILLGSSSSVGSISNSGTISGASGIRLRSGSSVTGAITNYAGGTISGNSNDGILLGSSSSVGSISNSGTISGSSTGIYLTSSTVTGAITNEAGGTIHGNNTGIYLNNASSVGSITNSGTISGSYGIDLTSSSVAGAITNNAGGMINGSNTGIYFYNGSASSITNNAGGTIHGGSTGIYLWNSSTVTGGIANSGTISGGTYAINVSGNSTLPNIDIAGTSARFIGDVFAQNTDVAVKAGATFANDNAFDVNSFTVENTATFNMGAGPNTSGMANGITVANGFTNAGTLAVADATTATITGNYTQTATGVLQVGASSAASYGKLVVTGNADLSASNKIAVNVAGVNTLAIGNVLPGVLTATGILTAGPTYTVTDNSALFNFSGATNGNAVDLTVLPGLTAAGSVAAVGNTPAAGAAAVFDTLINGTATGTADMGTILTALGLLGTQQQVSDAVGETLPLLTGGMAHVHLGNLHGVNRVVQARMEENRGLSSGDDFVGNRHAWIKPLGSWANQNNRNGAFGYAAQTFGVALGADGELSQVANIGVAFAYSHSNVNGNSGAQSAGISSYQAVLYGSRSLEENTEFNWQADYGYNQNKGSRYIALVNRTAASGYNSDSIHVGAGVGRTMVMNEKTSFTPSVRADYTTLRDKGYTETGAGALNLVVGGKNTDEFILAVDGKVAHKVSDTSTVTANLGVGYDVNAKQDSLTASFAGGGAAFSTAGINPSATVVRGGLGYVANTAGGVEVTARYDVESRSGFTGQTASVKARWAF